MRLIVLALACWVSSCAMAAEPLQWIAGSLPPFAWQEGGQDRGYACELVKAMALKLGRPERVSFYPWARAVKLARERPNFGVFPLARTPDREQQYLWLIPLLQVDYVFLETRAAAQAHPAQGQARVAELRTRRVGVLRGSPIVANLRAQGFTHIVEGKDYPELLQMLGGGLVEAIYAGKPMILASLQAGGHSEQAFRISATLGDAVLYMGASKDLGEAEAALWRSAYDALVKDGTVAQLQRKYALPKSLASGGRG